MHVHTPASFHHQFRFLNEEEKEKYQLNIWEKYISELEEVSDVSVIGITDYFTIDGYKKILEYREKGRLQNFDLILPNIEFRIGNIVVTVKNENKESSETKRLNYHVIFSDEIPVEKIEKEFLNELHIKTPAGEKRTLNKENIGEIG